MRFGSRLPVPVVLAALLLLPVAANAGFDIQDFTDTSALSLVGAAAPAGIEMRIVPAVPDQVGAVWFGSRQNVGKGFHTIFTFRLSDSGGGQNEADQAVGGNGLAFVIQNDKVAALGTGGSGLGYAGVTNSLAIEFDTWQDTTNGDPDGMHVSVQSRGLDANSSDHAYSLGEAALPMDLEDGQLHKGIIYYEPGLLRIFLDGDHTPVLVVPVDLETLLSLSSDRAWVGFTAATGAGWANHDLVTWYLREDLCELDLKIERDTLAPGESLRFGVYLHHRLKETVTVPLALWVEDASGDLIAGSRTVPKTFHYDDRLELVRELTIPQRTPPGSYFLVVGVQSMKQGIAWKRVPFTVE